MSSMLATRILPVYLCLALLIGFTLSLPAISLNSADSSLIKDSLALDLSQATILSLPISDTFPIPRTDLTLSFHQVGPTLDPSDLRSLFLEASSDIQHKIDQNGVNAASSERWYNYTSDGRLVLEVWSRSISPDGDVSLYELREVINGLSLYMMHSGRCRVLQFKVIQNMGSSKAIIANIGSIKQDLALPTTRAKREAAPLPLVQDSSTTSVTNPVNTSILSAPTADDFPIPHSDYSLRIDLLGSPLHPWDLETLLIAASAEIGEEITVHGRNARLPSSEYTKNLAGLQLWIQRMPWATVNLAWAELAIFVDGLWEYIVDGRNDREAFIDIINHVTATQVALGWIGKPRAPPLSTSLTGAARRA